MGFWRVLAVLPVSLLPVTLFLRPSRVDPTEQILGRYGRANAYYEAGATNFIKQTTKEKFWLWEFEREYRVVASPHQMTLVFNVRSWPPGGHDRLIGELCRMGWKRSEGLAECIDLVWPPHSSIHIPDGLDQIIYCRPATLGEQMAYGGRVRRQYLATAVGR